MKLLKVMEIEEKMGSAYIKISQQHRAAMAMVQRPEPTKVQLHSKILFSGVLNDH